MNIYEIRFRALDSARHDLDAGRYPSYQQSLGGIQPNRASVGEIIARAKEYEAYVNGAAPQPKKRKR